MERQYELESSCGRKSAEIQHLETQLVDTEVTLWLQARENAREARSWSESWSRGGKRLRDAEGGSLCDGDCSSARLTGAAHTLQAKALLEAKQAEMTLRLVQPLSPSLSCFASPGPNALSLLRCLVKPVPTRSAPSPSHAIARPEHLRASRDRPEVR